MPGDQVCQECNEEDHSCHGSMSKAKEITRQEDDLKQLQKMSKKGKLSSAKVRGFIAKLERKEEKRRRKKQEKTAREEEEEARREEREAREKRRRKQDGEDEALREAEREAREKRRRKQDEEDAALRAAGGEAFMPTDLAQLNGSWRTSERLHVKVSNGFVAGLVRDRTLKLEVLNKVVHLRREEPGRQCVVTKMSLSHIEWKTEHAGTVMWYKEY